MYNGRAKCFQTKACNTRDNVCKKYCLSSNHKKDNGNTKMRIFFVRRKPNQELIYKKGQRTLIEEFLNCGTFFLFFIYIKLKAFRVTQNETLKIEKNPPLLSSLHIIVRNTSCSSDYSN